MYGVTERTMYLLPRLQPAGSAARAAPETTVTSDNTDAAINVLTSFPIPHLPTVSM